MNRQIDPFVMDSLLEKISLPELKHAFFHEILFIESDGAVVVQFDLEVAGPRLVEHIALIL